MSRTIAVDPQVYEAIARLNASSGGRTPNDALRPLLGLPPKPPRAQSRTNEIVHSALRARPGITAAELATATGFAYSTITSVLANLERTGSAVREPDEKNRRRGRVRSLWRATASPTPPHDAEQPAATGPGTWRTPPDTNR